MRVQLHNVGVIENCDVEFIPGVNLIIGSSGSGKSTLMRSIYNIATNEFNDSDISFGKNKMVIKVEDDGNYIEYGRSLKAKGERCYYKVNGETYVKLGRQVLPAVADTLKISDLDISGESINFNFNLQFASPFLILGSQSTLYNVLTYRSSFDISSINDYYATDVRTNANEISTNEKLKERLTDNLEKLKAQEESLAPVEQLYSDYISYKHKKETVDQLSELLDLYKYVNSLSKKLEGLDSIIISVDDAIATASRLKEFTRYGNMCNNYNEVCNKVTEHKNAITHYTAALSYCGKLSDINSLSITMSKRDIVTDNLVSINDSISMCKSFIDKEPFIKDVIRQHELVKKHDKYVSITCLMNGINSDIVATLSDLFPVYKKLNAVHEVNSCIDDVDTKCNEVNSKLSEFDVCPLCGSALHNHCGN